MKKWQDEFGLLFEALRESFVATLPYVVLASLATLLFQAIKLFGPWLGFGNFSAALALAATLQEMFPAVILVSIAFHLARRFNIDGFSSVVLAVACAATLAMLFREPRADGALLMAGASLRAIAVPIVSTLVLRWLLERRIAEADGGQLVASEVAAAIRRIVPFALAFAIAVLLFIGIRPWLLLAGQGLHAFQGEFSEPAFLAVRMVGMHLLGFLGIHGSNTFDLIFDTAFLAHPIFAPLSHKAFYDLFVVCGGAGAGLSLLLAVLVGSQDGHSRRIGKLATPFVLFNINEILLFGLPLILNRYLLIPFLCVPILNFTVAYWVLSVPGIHFVDREIPWTTPIFLNAYLLTDGDFRAILLQLFCLLAGAAFYLPFVRRYTAVQSSSGQMRHLEQALDISALLDARNGRQFHAAQTSIIHSHEEIEKIIELFRQNRLIVYYQPKVDIEAGQCNQFEALLRLEMRDGKVLGPYFLDILESAGMAPLIDQWVSRQVSRDMAVWAAENFHPRISINLHPETIFDTRVVLGIADMLAGRPIDFEVIERGDVNLRQGLDNLRLLGQRGFRIALDDFGSGYAGFVSLNSLPLDIVKLDKNLIDAAIDDKGRTIYVQAVKLCVGIGVETVAEGIATEAQLALVRHAGVRYVQGFYFSPAIHPNLVPSFGRRRHFVSWVVPDAA